MRSILQQKEKTEVIVGFEPTGHYWFTLGDYVKCTRELDDNSQTKSDCKDPKTIAMLVKDGRFRDVYIPADLYQELREAVPERERLQEQLISSHSLAVKLRKYCLGDMVSHTPTNVPSEIITSYQLDNQTVISTAGKVSFIAMKMDLINSYLVED